MNYSTIWLLALAIFAVLTGVRIWWRSDYSTWESTLYLPAYLFGRLLWRVHFTNDPPEELRRGAIIAANHRSSIDPFFVQLAARRRVHWMVAKEYCQNPTFGIILKALQVIPTNRTGNDTIATRIAMQYTQNGSLVGMFPEGKINTSRDVLLPVRAGAALVAIKSGVPILPLYIQGSPYHGSVTAPFTTPARVKLSFGKPIYPDVASLEQSDDSNAPEPVSNRIRNNLQATTLIKQWGQALTELACQPNFDVQVGSRIRDKR